jgi:CheY-like chemotaxis protein
MLGEPWDRVDVLLVEDDPGDAVMIIESFAHAGAPAAFHAVGSCEALRFLRRAEENREARRPGLIILDLDLPGDHGLQFLAEVKADAELRTIPVIVLSGSRRPSDIRRSKALRADAFITKPRDFDGYADVIDRISVFVSECAATGPR